MEQGTFSVSAEGKVVAIPDIAQTSFGVLEEGGTDIAKLQEENTRKVNSVIEFLKEKGIEAKDIKTQNYTIEPRYQYFSCPNGGRCPPPEIIGYRVSQNVLVKIRDFGIISEVFSGVVQRGANTVSQLSFTVDDPSSLKQDAREQAIAKAKDQAKAVAGAGGFRLGRLVGVSE